MKKAILKSVALLTAIISTSSTIGTVVSADAADSYDSTATVRFEEGHGPVDPVDPTDPETPVKPTDPDGNPSKPGGKGALSIDFASSLSFGRQTVSTKDQTYYAHAQALSDGTSRPDYVQVTDQRGSLKGWSLSVKTSSQFHLEGVEKSEEEAKAGDYLKGAELSFSGGYIAGSSMEAKPSFHKTDSYVVGNDETKILTAGENEGAGTWVYGLGAGESGNSKEDLAKNNEAYYENGGKALGMDEVSKKSPISLKVLGNKTKMSAVYTTDLIWTLSDTPAN